MFKCDKCLYKNSKKVNLHNHLRYKNDMCKEDRFAYMKRYDNVKEIVSQEARENIRKSRIGKKHTEETKLKMSESKLKLGLKWTKERKEYIKKTFKGRKGYFSGYKHSKESRKKISNSLSGKNGYWYGKTHSKKSKEKMRYAKIKRIKELGYGFYPNIGRNEKNLLDKQEFIDNCIIDRDFSILGFFPDGYCRETNTVYEVYESYHLKEKQIKKDLERQHTIQD